MGILTDIVRTVCVAVLLAGFVGIVLLIYAAANGVLFGELPPEADNPAAPYITDYDADHQAVTGLLPGDRSQYRIRTMNQHIHN
jgi:hypothetical protein